MVLLVCHPYDEATMCLYDYCKKKGLKDIMHINADVLTSSFYWRYAVNSFDNDDLEIKLYNGKTVDVKNVSIFFNRIQYVHMGMWDRAEKGEKDYATQEFYSFFLSWLHSFGRKIVNKPTPGDLSGVHRHKAIWRYMAQEFGIPVLDIEIDSHKEFNPLVNNGVTGKTTVYAIGKKLIHYIPGMPAYNRITEFIYNSGIHFAELTFYRHEKLWKLDTVNTSSSQFHTSHQCMEALFQFFLEQNNYSYDINSRYSNRKSHSIAV